MIKKALLLSALGLALNWASPAGANDLFQGTLEIKDGRPYLVRCDLAQSTYLLVTPTGEDYDLQALKQLGAGAGQVVQASILGQAIMDSQGANLRLTVERVADVKPGSCHLGNLFE